MVVAVRTEQIKCRTEGCEQVIAKRWPGGGVKPVGDWFLDERGRPVVICPACGERNRMPERRDF